MLGGIAIALIGLVLVIGGAVKVIFGGFDGLIAIVIGAAFAIAGIEDSRIKPASK